LQIIHLQIRSNAQEKRKKFEVKGEKKTNIKKEKILAVHFSSANKFVFPFHLWKPFYGNMSKETMSYRFIILHVKITLKRKEERQPLVN